MAHEFNGPYTGDNLNHLAFPLGGIGAGMLCLEGAGGLTHVSVQHRPRVGFQPCMFAAVSVAPTGASEQRVARVLEGPVAAWKRYNAPNAANGQPGATFGLPRFARAEFLARFPFGTVTLTDPALLFHVKLTGWSPFEPNAEDDSSLPVAALEYTLTNTSQHAVDFVWSFHARNFLAAAPSNATLPPAEVRQITTPDAKGFVFTQAAPADQAQRAVAFAALVRQRQVATNTNWFRGGWWDALTLAWRDVETGACYDQNPPTDGTPSPGATIFAPLQLEAGASETIQLALCWYASQSDIGFDTLAATSTGPYYQPFYASKHDSIDAVAHDWAARYDALRAGAARFRDAFFASTAPPEVLEAVSANLSILKTPTVLRQKDGRLWAWEGCGDAEGCCGGSCSHVWNYAQALPHLFPRLERTLRETEFQASQDDHGHQTFRSALPIAPAPHQYHAAADGQLGGVMKVYREWRISGDGAWLARLWPRVRRSLDYGINTWDPQRAGWLSAVHHNTYDIEFWGPDGMCTSIYLGALAAAVEMGRAVDADVSGYAALRDAARQKLEAALFNGAYFEQRVDPHLPERAALLDSATPEARRLYEAEGSPYQYGAGCLSDGVIGAWLAQVCGLGVALDADQVRSHLVEVLRHNFRESLAAHSNPQRPTYALGDEAGLLLCTWPRGGKPTLPFVYSDEVWTGIEYQVASHLMMCGEVDGGLRLVRAARRRYSGVARDPFDEYECGHWYARALASYALLQGVSGARYDAVTRTLHLAPPTGGDFVSFLSTATGYGLVGLREGEVFVEVRAGVIEVERVARASFGDA